MQPIQKPQRPKINHELLMMQIMHLRRAIKEIIPTMHRRRFKKLKRQKEPVGKDMTPKDLRWNRDWEDVGEQVLERMSVLGCECDGGREAVVLLMDACV